MNAINIDRYATERAILHTKDHRSRMQNSLKKYNKRKDVHWAAPRKVYELRP